MATPYPVLRHLGTRSETEEWLWERTDDLSKITGGSNQAVQLAGLIKAQAGATGKFRVRIGGTPRGIDGTLGPEIQVSGTSQGTVLVPAYFSGSTPWNTLTTQAALARIIAIGNPASGPGTTVNAGYVTKWTAFRAARGILIGYVRTDYGNQNGLAPLTTIKAQIDKWVELYAPNVDGIFFDEQENGAEDIAFYEEIFDYARDAIANAVIVSNPGAGMAEGYISSASRADIYVIYENDGVPAVSAPAYAGTYGKDSFAALLHDAADEATCLAFIDDCEAEGIGGAYATTDGGANPWDTLVPFFATEVAAIDSQLGADNDVEQSLASSTIAIPNTQALIKLTGVSTVAGKLAEFKGGVVRIG